MKKRVLLAGLFHETHTFLPGVTPLDDFKIRRGDELLSALGDGSPLAGVLEVARECEWTLIPAIDLRATPSAIVDDGVVETFWEWTREVAGLSAERGLDGIFVVLHGAMVSQSLPDVEGEVLERIAGLPEAAGVPICGVTDLHGNFTARMAAHANALIAYRENPHTDAHAAAVDAARLLDRAMRQGRSPRTVWEHPPVMWPPTGTGTANFPMRWLEDESRRIEQAHPQIAAVNVYAGFSFADTPDTGVSLAAVTWGDPEEARAELRRLSLWIVENRRAGNVVDTPLAEVMPKLAGHREGPVLLVEPSDNIGGGAPGDGVGVLKAFIEHGVANAAVVINDPQAVAQLAGRPAGSHATLPIGGKENTWAGGPLTLNVELLGASDGRFDLEDRHSHLASMSGTRIEMGRCATVRYGGVHILLTSLKTPPFDLGQLRSQGIVPEKLFAIGVKAAVAHRRAYDPITRASYTVDTPGPCSSNLQSFPFRQIRRPIYPLDELA